MEKPSCRVGGGRCGRINIVLRRWAA